MLTIRAAGLPWRHLGIVFGASVLVLVLGLVVCACGPAIAHFYSQPALTWITVGLGLPLILDGLATQHLALLRRNMRYSALVVGQVGFQASYFLVSVVMAVLGFGYWSLVFGHAFGTVAAVTLTFVCCRWMPGRPPKGTKIGGLLRFGTHVLGSNIVNYFSGNADNILVGRFLGADQLGLYSRAFNFFALPMTQIRDPIQRVGLPTLRVLVDEPERFRRYFLRIVNLVATLSFPLGLVCVIAGEFFVHVLLGRQWLAAVPVFRILGAVMLISPVVSTLGLVQLSTGQSRRYLHWNTLNAVVFVSSFVAGLHWGIVGVAAAYAVANYLLFLPAAVYGLARSPVKVRDFVSTLLVPLGTSAVGAAVALAVMAVAGNGLLGEGLAMAAFLVVYSGLSLGRRSVRDMLHRLWRFRLDEPDARAEGAATITGPALAAPAVAPAAGLPKQL